MEKIHIITAVLIAVATSIVSAAPITADADGYSNGTDISTAFYGMTLSSAGGYSGLDGNVYAWEDGLASTGISVFANNTGQLFYEAHLSGKPVYFFGTTVAGAAYLLKLKHLCPHGA